MDCVVPNHPVCLQPDLNIVLRLLDHTSHFFAHCGLFTSIYIVYPSIWKKGYRTFLTYCAIVVVSAHLLTNIHALHLVKMFVHGVTSNHLVAAY